MKLYNGMSPNGMRINVFLAEKDIEIPTTNINVMAGDTQKPDYLAINSLGEVPVLELDDGQIITESLAICRYLEVLHPEPSLMGVSAAEQANIEMWTRRIEQQIFSTVGTIGLHEIPYFAYKIEQFPNYAASLRKAFPKKLAWLEKEMSDGRPYIAGDKFSIADITGMAALMVCGFIKIEIPDEFKQVNKWAKAMQSRPSWPTMPG
ncbi:MAG: glutathione S-transferase family protein [Robiginitomaculum sp.]|nr:glutathione S-transferase family protein [Robiginitomaculum sp.]